MNNVLIDAHFSEKGRQGRLVRLAHDIGVERALGIDEDTALVCTGNHCQVHGSAGVWLVDMSKHNVGDQSCQLYADSYCSLNNILTSFITRDDVIDLESWTVEFADWKQRVVEDENMSSSESDDIFGTETKGEYGRVVKSLLLSKDAVTTSRTVEQTPVNYGIVFRKCSYDYIFNEHQTDAVDDGEGFISYRNLVLDIVALNVRE